MLTRRGFSRVCAGVFRRNGIFRRIEEEGLPCVTERIARVIGEIPALELAQLRYLSTQAKILGYLSPYVHDRIAARVQQLLPLGLEIPPPYSFSAIDNMPAARRIARSLNGDLFSSKMTVSRNEYNLAPESCDGLRLVIEFDGFKGYPDLRFFSPQLRLVVNASSILSVDLEGYLSFDDLDLFSSRYTQIIKLVHAVQSECHRIGGTH